MIRIPIPLTDLNVYEIVVLIVAAPFVIYHLTAFTLCMHYERCVLPPYCETCQKRMKREAARKKAEE